MSSPAWFSPDSREQAQFVAGILKPTPPDQLLRGLYIADWTGLAHGVQLNPGWVEGNISGGGGGILDLTDSQFPVFVNSGVYAISATIFGTPAAASTATIYTEIDIDVDGSDAGSSWGNALIGDTEIGWGLALPMTFFAAAGQTLSIDVTHNDASQTIDGRSYVVIQQLS